MSQVFDYLITLPESIDYGAWCPEWRIRDRGSDAWSDRADGQALFASRPGTRDAFVSVEADNARLATAHLEAALRSVHGHLERGPELPAVSASRADDQRQYG